MNYSRVQDVLGLKHELQVAFFPMAHPIEAQQHANGFFHLALCGGHQKGDLFAHAVAVVNHLHGRRMVQRSNMKTDNNNEFEVEVEGFCSSVHIYANTRTSFFSSSFL